MNFTDLQISFFHSAPSTHHSQGWKNNIQTTDNLSITSQTLPLISKLIFPLRAFLNRAFLQMLKISWLTEPILAMWA